MADTSACMHAYVGRCCGISRKSLIRLFFSFFTREPDLSASSYSSLFSVRPTETLRFSFFFLQRYLFHEPRDEGGPHRLPEDA